MSIEKSLSPARLDTYKKASKGNLSKAILLYQWNVDISTAFLPVLHILEVSIRNTISDTLSQVYGNNWAWCNSFVLSLPNNKDQRKPLIEKAAKSQNHIGDVISGMNFIFWQKMLTARFNQNIWQTHLKTTFPNIGTATISDLYKELNQIRTLRNRIAHHEPIFNRNLHDDFQIALKLIGYIDKDVEAWIKNIQSVTYWLARKPI